MPAGVKPRLSRGRLRAVCYRSGERESRQFRRIPIGSALAGVLGSAVGTRARAAFGTIGPALSAVPMLARQLAHAAAAKAN
jgi:hypothetical protein